MNNTSFTQLFGPYLAGVHLPGLQEAGVDQIELHRGSGWLHARLLLDHFAAFEEIEAAERAVAKGLGLSSVEFRPLYRFCAADARRSMGHFGMRFAASTGKR